MQLLLLLYNCALTTFHSLVIKANYDYISLILISFIDCRSYGQTLCTSCAAGKYQPSTGRGECIDCIAGKYVASTGNTVDTACTYCGTGRYTEGGSGFCLQCPRGQYQDVTGSTECIDCAAGYYMATEGATVCSQCSAGESH